MNPSGRAASSGWSSFINSFYLTAHFSEEDYVRDTLYTEERAGC